MKNTVYAPPSKSITHRVLMCASLCKGESLIKNPLISDDTKRTIECFRELGTSFDFLGNKIKVIGIQNTTNIDREVQLNVGESGTTCRLITPIVCALPNLKARIYGEGRMHKRPVGELTEVLSSLGAQITHEERYGYPPFKVTTKGLRGGKISISLEKSSQFLSGLLLAAPLATQRMEIEISGNKAVSWPYVALTIFTMKKFGVDVLIYQLEDGKGWVKKEITDIEKVVPGKIKFIIEPSKYKCCTFQVEGDWSNASYFIAAGLFLKHGLKIKGLFKDSLQGDRKIVDILKKMGARIYFKEDTLVSEPSNLHGIDINMKDCPDLVPTVSVVASLASSRTTIRGVEHLKIKESDRLLGVATEIKKVGSKVEVFEDGLAIEPRPIPTDKEVSFSTYADHRMAMSLSIYELVGVKVKLDNVQCVAKSFPNFFDVWDKVKKNL